MENKKPRKRKRDNCIVEFFAEISFTVIVEVAVNIIVNILLFIPRALIRFFSHL